MGWLVAVLVLAVLQLSVGAEASSCMAEIDDGLGYGLNDIGVTGMRMCVFYGIPYAKPPTGKLRFEPPQPLIWKGRDNFVQRPNKCPQFNSFDTDAVVEGDEDCLYLNVYRPLKPTTREPLPVFVWIHGGSFMQGSFESDINGFDHLIKQDIIVVSLNYRLGPLGFLYLPQLNITGNMGLKDQQLALEWVSRNIKNFGGDPSRVTLAGWSAGAASVTYHLYNRRSSALFQRAVVMSGTMLQPWAYISPNDWCALNFLDYVSLSSREELQSVDFMELVPRIRLSLMVGFFGMLNFCFVPVQEPEGAVSRFLTASPSDLVQLEPSNATVLFGFTNLESAPVYPSIEYFMSNVDFPNTNMTVVNETIRRYIDSYIAAHHRGKTDEKLFLIRLASMSDSFYGFRMFMEAHAGTLFGYQFAFDGRFGNFKLSSNPRWRSLPGAIHGDDLGYVFVPFMRTSDDVDDLGPEILTTRQMVEMWSNFVKFGNPTPVTNKVVTTIWKPYTRGGGDIMNINGTLEMQPLRKTEDFQLWDRIYNCLQKWKCDFLNDVQEEV